MCAWQFSPAIGEERVRALLRAPALGEIVEERICSGSQAPSCMRHQRRGLVVTAAVVAIPLYGEKYGYLLDCVDELQWDDGKNSANLAKHHVSFFEAQLAFADPHRVIARDLSHSKTEERFYCSGRCREAFSRCVLLIEAA